MKTIKYRKLTAQALGKEIIELSDKSISNILKHAIGLYVSVIDTLILWHPESNPIQREMVEDWVIKQGYWIFYTYDQILKSWLCHIPETKHGNAPIHCGESKSIAFAEAFLEFMKQHASTIKR